MPDEPRYSDPDYIPSESPMTPERIAWVLESVQTVDDDGMLRTLTYGNDSGAAFSAVLQKELAEYQQIMERERPADAAYAQLLNFSGDSMEWVRQYEELVERNPGFFDQIRQKSWDVIAKLFTPLGTIVLPKEH